MTPELSVAAPISTERLDLVLLTAAWLRAYVEGEPLPELGFADPDGFLFGADHVVGLRVGQVGARACPGALAATRDRRTGERHRGWLRELPRAA